MSKAINIDDLKKFLTPPGNGVFTVKTAEDVIQSVQKDIYQTTNKDEVTKAWEKGIEQLPTTDKPFLLEFVVIAAAEYTEVLTGALFLYVKAYKRFQGTQTIMMSATFALSLTFFMTNI